MVCSTISQGALSSLQILIQRQKKKPAMREGTFLSLLLAAGQAEVKEEPDFMCTPPGFLLDLTWAMPKQPWELPGSESQFSHVPDHGREPPV